MLIKIMKKQMDKISKIMDRKISRDSSQSLFSQLEEILREGIDDGTWKPGEPIPSERELSKIYGLCRMTVRKAIDRLVAAGLIYKVDGKGTFVSEPKVSFQALSLAGLREQTLKMGYSPSTKLLGIERVLASKNMSSYLHVEPNSPIFVIERVVFVNNIPLALHRSHIPENLCPSLPEYDLTNASLYSILKEKFEINIHHMSEMLETTLASVRESLLLGIEPGSPMFLLRITAYDPDQKPVEYVKVIFRGDRVQLSINL